MRSAERLQHCVVITSAQNDNVDRRVDVHYLAYSEL